MVFRRNDPHSIYLDHGDPQSQATTCHTDAVHQRMQAATRVINLVEHDLRHQTVQKAALEMEKVVELSDGQQECLLVRITFVYAFVLVYACGSIFVAESAGGCRGTVARDASDVLYDG